MLKKVSSILSISILCFSLVSAGTYKLINKTSMRIRAELNVGVGAGLFNPTLTVEPNGVGSVFDARGLKTVTIHGEHPQGATRGSGSHSVNVSDAFDHKVFTADITVSETAAGHVLVRPYISEIKSAVKTKFFDAPKQ